MKIIIYKAACKITGRVYIGQTRRSLEIRIKEHQNNSSRRFPRAIRKYGIGSFEWTILETHENVQTANEREVALISEHNSYLDGYNSHPGGRAGGYTTKESIQRRQESRNANGGYESVSERQLSNNTAKRPEVRDKIATSVAKLWQDPDYRMNQLKKRWKANPLVKCVHCHKEGRNTIMQRWHFSKCKKKL